MFRILYSSPFWSSVLKTNGISNFLAKMHAELLCNSSASLDSERINRVITFIRDFQTYLRLYLATETAATRRGWVTPIIPDFVYPLRWSIWESWVLFPEPVSPITTTTGFCSTVSMIFSSNWRIGSCAIDESTPLHSSTWYELEKSQWRHEIADLSFCYRYSFTIVFSEILTRSYDFASLFYSYSNVFFIKLCNLIKIYFIF